MEWSAGRSHRRHREFRLPLGLPMTGGLPRVMMTQGNVVLDGCQTAIAYARLVTYHVLRGTTTRQGWARYMTGTAIRSGMAESLPGRWVNVYQRVVRE